MKKLSKIDESIWSDMQRRAEGSDIRKEDVGISVTVDGVKYNLSRSFMELGEEFNNENSDEWKFIAFHLPENGRKTITGNDIGVFGINHYDLEEFDDNMDYDVYILKQYTEYKSKEDLINKYIELGYYKMNSDEQNPIKDILIKYTRKVFDENHMSEFAEYQVKNVLAEYNNNDEIITLNIDTQGGSPVNLPIDFEDKEIVEVHYIFFPNLTNNWSDGLYNELTKEYVKEGFLWLKDYEPDFDIPANTKALCFIKFKN